MSEEKLRAIIADNITKLLAWNEKSQTDLAKYLKVSQGTVSHWCKGEKLPRMDRFDMICNYFNISRGDMFKEITLEHFKSDRRTKRLIELWHQLNADGQYQLIDQAELLANSEKYSSVFQQAEERRA